MSREPIIIRDAAMQAKVVTLINALDLGKPWRVTIEPFKKRRTLDQNALYHRWVGIVADETGHTHDEIHEWAKAEFLAPRVVDVNGKRVEYRSTTSLNTANMSEYMERFFSWATSDLGLLLPIPEEMHR